MTVREICSPKLRVGSVESSVTIRQGWALLAVLAFFDICSRTGDCIIQGDGRACRRWPVPSIIELRGGFPSAVD